MVRVAALSLASALIGSVDSQNDLEGFVINWVQGQAGNSVGDGECTSLLEGAEDAARSAGFSVPKMTRGCYSDTSIYCWSDTEINWEDLQAGDFVQFKDWKEKITESDGSWHSKSAKHHSAVVREAFDGYTLKVWEQNPNPVGEGEYHPYVGTGEIHGFRMGGPPPPSPYPGCYDYDNWADQEGETCGNFQQGNWCTSSGGQGSGWLSKWGDITGYYDSNGNNAFAACCACGGGYYPSPSPAPYAAIQSTATGLCLDLPSGDTTNGNVVWMWDCYGGESQQWSFQDDQLVYLPDTSKCVDLLGGDTTNGNQLAIWDCYGGDSQQFGFDPDYGTIYLASSKHDASKCVWSAEKGSPVAIWDCNSDSTQMWALGSSLAREVVV